MDDELKSALKKCAGGLSASEVVEEYAVTEGELKLVKRKVTTRDIPPDIKAVKMLMDERCESFTDEQLEAEKLRLEKILRENDFD